ncbi:Uncharacterized protein Adt_21039 [Abeliophyllum distichum]|uniref:Uncharacterized protein n=1 Tax=Abeliophyllum distichum TaxID=126358 RepID=A0ABD1SYD6_9LAMI
MMTKSTRLQILVSVRKLVNRANAGVRNLISVKVINSRLAWCSGHLQLVLKNEETELRTLYLKEKLAKIQGKSCNQSDSEANSLDPYSNIVCLDILNNMKRVSNEVYMKAIKAFKDPNFRVSFVKMPKAMRGLILELL